jgi:hypothetical protein
MAHYEVGRVAKKRRQRNRGEFNSWPHEVAMKVRQKNRGEFTSWPT